MPNSKQIVYLSQNQYAELIANGEITVDGVTVTYNENDIYVTPQTEPVTDVRINGTSIAANGVANVPIASTSTLGVIKVDSSWLGHLTNAEGKLYHTPPEDNVIKNGNDGYHALSPLNQHKATFYGLAKAAGHDEKNSTEPIGTYTPEAKAAIQSMLGVSDLIASAEDPALASKAYNVGDVFTTNGKLYKVVSAIAIGDAIVLQNEGETVTGANAVECKATDYAVHDVQVNGATVVQNGVANVPIANNTGNLGVVKGFEIYGTKMHGSDGSVMIARATSEEVKSGIGNYKPIVPVTQHEATFFGLAKAAGDTTQSASNNAVGSYTDEAKSAIQTMLDVPSNSDVTNAIGSAIGNIHQFEVQVVQTLPAENIQEHTVYFVPKTGETNDVYDEYIYVNNTWEMIGNTQIDLSGYVQSSELADVATSGDYDDLTNKPTIPEVPVQDVQVNGTSVLSNGVANIPVGDNTNLGVVKRAGTGYSINIESDGSLKIVGADSATIKMAGSNSSRPILPDKQHESVFYGLAKASGDTTQAASDNAVGTYTEAAKASIRNMLGAASPNVIAVQDTQPTNTDTKVWLPETQAAGVEVPTMADMNTALAGKVSDVQVNGASVVTNGVANVPKASTSALGVSGIEPSFGILINDSGKLYIGTSNLTEIKGGTQGYKPIVPANQHSATFYGLAKAAGDTTQAASSNTVGTYTSEASAAIRTMLGTPSNADLSSKADKTDTVLESTLSRGRLEESEVGEGSFAFGYDVEASGDYSHAEGQETYAYGVGSHAEGNVTVAVGDYSHAEGDNTEADGLYSHAEGSGSMAVGDQSHASGLSSKAYGKNSFTAGVYTIANGDNSFVHGQYNVEDNYFSWPTWESGISYTVGDKVKRYRQSMDEPVWTGYICTTDNNDIEFDVTKWDKDSSMNYVEIVGNGNTENTRSNAYVLDWSGNGRFAGDVYVNCNDDSTGGTKLPHDVQVNGTSVVSDGVANVPAANSSSYGVVKPGNGLLVNSSGVLSISSASVANCKQQVGSTGYQPITVFNQDAAAFYGLATAAGDTTQKSSANSVGTYTAEAKAAIQQMLGIDLSSIAAEVEIPLIETVSGTTPSITGQPNTRYVCGEVSTISITPPAAGSIDVFFDSGSTPTVITVPNTVKWPSWFDATALEANTTYEILITDGVYGSVMTWAN